MRNRRRWVALAVAVVLSLMTIACETFAVRRAQQARSALGDRLYVEAVGSGARTIVFLPGLLGSTRYWRAAGLVPIDGPSRFLYLDLLGFGRSPWPDAGYALDDHVMALRRSLVHENATSRITLVAHSFGALVAVEYAARFPDDIDCIVLFGAPVYQSADEARRGVGGMSWLAGMTVRQRLIARVICTLHNAMGPLAGAIAVRLRPDLPVVVARDGTLHFWPSLDGTIRNAILGHPLTDSLRRTRPAVIFVHGTHDRVAPVDGVRAVAAEHGARFIETADDHGSYWRTAGPVLVQILGPDVVRTPRQVRDPRASHEPVRVSQRFGTRRPIVKHGESMPCGLTGPFSKSAARWSSSRSSSRPLQTLHHATLRRNARKRNASHPSCRSARAHAVSATPRS